MYFLSPDKFERACAYIIACEDGLVGQAVVARNDGDGKFLLGKQSLIFHISLYCMLDDKIQDYTTMSIVSHFFHHFSPFLPASLCIQISILHVATSSLAKISPKSLRMMTSLRTNFSFKCVISKRKDEQC